MKTQGALKIRHISKSSLGLTLPKELVTNLDISSGLYFYEASKLEGKIYIKMSMLTGNEV